MSIAIFFTFAASILPWIAWFLADWRVLCYATSAPLAIAIFTPWFVPESARWLVSQGKVDRAVEILRKFERINGTKVEESVYKQFKVSWKANRSSKIKQLRIQEWWFPYWEQYSAMRYCFEIQKHSTCWQKIGTLNDGSHKINLFTEKQRKRIVILCNLYFKRP